MIFLNLAALPLSSVVFVFCLYRKQNAFAILNGLAVIFNFTIVANELAKL